MRFSRDIAPRGWPLQTYRCGNSVGGFLIPSNYNALIKTRGAGVAGITAAVWRPKRRAAAAAERSIASFVQCLSHRLSHRRIPGRDRGSSCSHSIWKKARWVFVHGTHTSRRLTPLEGLLSPKVELGANWVLFFPHFHGRAYSNIANIVGSRFRFRAGGKPNLDAGQEVQPDKHVKNLRPFRLVTED